MRRGEAVVTISDESERLAKVLAAVAKPRHLGDMRIVAAPFYRWEAVVLAPDRDEWEAVYDYLVVVLESANRDLVQVHVVEKHGELAFAIVPFTAEGAGELAAEIEQRYL
jgi:hypothetical protein